MAMLAGSVVIDEDGSETKSGFAQTIYDQFISTYTSATGQVMPSGAEAVAVKRNLAWLANTFSTSTVTYLAANAQAKIGLGVAGLQRSTDPGDLTAADGFIDNYLPIV